MLEPSPQQQQKIDELQAVVEALESKFGDKMDDDDTLRVACLIVFGQRLG